MGMGRPNRSGRVVPKSAAQSLTSGSIAMGMSNRPQMVCDQRPLWMSYSIVRAALVASVAWTAPPVRFQISQLSTVPKARSPACARSRAPSTWSRIHFSLVAEK